MITGGFGRRRSIFEPPIEMRFVDLFLIIVTTLMFITVMLSIISAFVGSASIYVAPQVATKMLPTALLNRPYYLALSGVGGANPYTWVITDGSLPDGLKLDATTGTISGTPQQIQRAQFTVQLTDAEHRSDKRQMVLQVANTGQGQVPAIIQIHVTSDTIILPDAVGHNAYTFHFAAYGGTPPYRWVLVEGKLPPGLNLTPSGDIVGTPTTGDNTWSFTVKIVDATGIPAMQHARLLVKAAPPPLWISILLWGVFWVVFAVGSLLILLVLSFILFGFPETPPSGGTERIPGMIDKIAERFFSKRRR